MPEWLVIFAAVSLVVAVICTLVIVGDLLAGHPQKMWIMNFVWPITALYAGPFALYAYFATGRLSTRESVQRAMELGEQNPGKNKPFWQIVAVGATHCGSGCTLGDLAAEWIVLAAPIVIFGHKIFGTWVLDFILAYIFGIAFQYFTIKPMKNLSPGQGLLMAIKADTLSLAAWQVGMYGWMAFATFIAFGYEIPKTSPVFWFMMQIAMTAGFLTSYPVNWWLIRKGIKEPM
ncbi:MAG TPA: DUF4396 domain-containing protein [Terriglobales bacterium]|nr:DUF4396 domain-containing protein [Terriglobales bacterium]